MTIMTAIVQIANRCHRTNPSTSDDCLPEGHFKWQVFRLTAWCKVNPFD